MNTRHVILLLVPFVTSVTSFADDVAPTPDFSRVVQALEKGQAAPILERLAPPLRGQVDAPVMQFFVDRIRAEYGSIQALPTERVSTTRQEHDGVTYDVSQAIVPFERGEVKVQVVTDVGHIAGVTLDCTVTADLPSLFYDTIAEKREGHEALTAHYASVSESFLKLLHAGDDKAAFASFHPLAAEQLGFEKTSADFARVRERFGTFQGLKLHSAGILRDKDGKVYRIALDLNLDASREDAVVRCEFQLVGLKAHLMGYSIFPLE